MRYNMIQVDRKALKERYKRMKPDMGVFVFKCMPTGKAYLGFSQNVKAELNSLTFQLKLGSYPTNRNLLKDWIEYGEAFFEVAVIELLGYDKDESKTDYAEDLKLLRACCAE
ncbi:MAG: GIY-YIG nuclease family protein, partial [Firmicutes bacterium]|nr:GIY-YIG nuclease family protein [Bacillota bacterium]